MAYWAVGNIMTGEVTLCGYGISGGDRTAARLVPGTCYACGITCTEAEERVKLALERFRLTRFYSRLRALDGHGG